VFVDILGKLRAGALQGYDGRSSLSTWLYIYSRSRCIDFLRTSELRRTRPAQWRTLSKLERLVFRLYWLERLSPTAIVEQLKDDGHQLTLDDLATVLERLEASLGVRARRRLAFDLCAQSIGVTSGRLLEYLHELKIENEDREDGSQPERALLQEHLARAIDLVREHVSRLPDLERQVIDLRFYQGRTARQASDTLQLRGQREVYTVEARAIRQLRDMMQA
jgi:DNA-directed RNA polymerase specialized sigma24 family protein